MELIQKLQARWNMWISFLICAFLSKMTPKQRAYMLDKHGNVLALVVTLISLAVVLVVGIMVVYNLDTTTDAMDLGATGNTTRDSLFTNINTAITLTIIVPIIAGAGLLIAVVIAYLGKST